MVPQKFSCAKTKAGGSNPSTLNRHQLYTEIQIRRPGPCPKRSHTWWDALLLRILEEKNSCHFFFLSQKEHRMDERINNW